MKGRGGVSGLEENCNSMLKWQLIIGSCRNCLREQLKTGNSSQRDFHWNQLPMAIHTYLRELEVESPSSNEELPP